MKEIVEEYFPALDEEPWNSIEEEREAYLKFLDMLSLIRIQVNEDEANLSYGRIGTYLTDVELMAAIEPHERGEFRHKKEVLRVFAGLLKKKGGRIGSVLRSGILSPIECLALLLALSYSLSRKYEGIYGILQGEDGKISKPGIGLCADLGRLFLDDEQIDISELFSQDSFLNIVFLEKLGVPGGEVDLSRPLILKHQALMYFLGNDGMLGELSLCAKYETPITAGYVCHPELVQEISDVYTAAFA